jgi:hypothetical protein
VASQPNTYHVERSATLNAPAGVVFPLANDFRHWAEWSPWSKLDPQMKTTFGGPPEGAGATYAWTGNDKVGEGRMTITESQPDTRVTYRLEFLKPFVSIATTSVTLTPDAPPLGAPLPSARTRVTWGMDGNNNFVGKAFTLFSNMDQIIGKDFEQGLAQLKLLAEAGAQRRLAEEAAQKAAAQAAATTPSPGNNPATQAKTATP